MKSFIHSFLSTYLLPGILFFVLSMTYFEYIYKLPFVYGDENYLLGTSYFFELLIKRDFNNILWKTHNGYDQPKLVEYLFGAIIYPQYLKEKQNHRGEDYDMIFFLTDHNIYHPYTGQILSKNTELSQQTYADDEPLLKGGKYQDYKDRHSQNPYWRKNDQGSFDYYIKSYGAGFYKTLRLVLTVRSVNAVILALSGLVVFYLGKTLFDSKIGFISGLLYGLNPLVLEFGPIAHGEAFFLLFFTLSVLIMIKIFKEDKFTLPKLLLFAFLASLLVQAKLNGVVVLLIFNLIFSIKTLSFFGKTQILALVKKGAYLLLVNVTAFILFVTLNPYLYANPIQNSIFMFTHRANRQEAQLLRSTAQLFDWSQRLDGLITNFFGSKAYYFNNIDLLNFDNRRLVSVLDISLFIFGILYILRQVRIENRLLSQKPFLFLVMAFLSFLITVGYLELSWRRYYIHLVFIIAIIESCGFFALSGILGRILLKKIILRF